jgi:hypothetical protein
MIDVAALLDLADLAVSRCEGTLTPSARRDFARVVRRARRRVGYGGEVLVVAFAGGTGSGKSSLINAIVGDTVVRIGVIRPTTDMALAVLPRRSAARYGQLLSELEVGARVESDRLEEFILIDLPDLDSIEASHKHIVESVLPAVDAVVWALDPEKYADATVHTEFLANLVPYEEQFLFALNQVDRLPDTTAAVLQDLVQLLEADGFVAPAVFSTIARGADLDVSELAEALASRLDTKRTVLLKIVTDLRIAANEGWLAARNAGSGNTDEGQMDEIGLAAATFVSLGVQASEVLSRLKES